MERIDQLENQIISLQSGLQDLAAGRPPNNVLTGEAQNLKDREIIEFLEGSQ